MSDFEISNDSIKRLERIIVLKENINLKKKELNDKQMVTWIKKQIEEEAKCYSNQ